MPDAMPHGEISEVLPDVFWMQGTVRMGPGVIINRNMVLLRHEGTLTVVNAVRPLPEKKAEIDALGTVENVVKIGMHGMDDAWYVETYGAKYWAAEGVDPEGSTVHHRLGPDGPQPVPWMETIRAVFS